MYAETAYLFRHALLREAAYQLQLPGDRAKLHALAFDVIEATLAQAPLPSRDAASFELAQHARRAQDWPGADVQRFLRAEVRYLLAAGAFARVHWQFAESCACFDAAAECKGAETDEVIAALTRGAQARLDLGDAAGARPRIERATALARANHSAALGDALIAWARCLRVTGSPDAEAVYDEALAVFRAASDLRGEYDVLSGRGMLLKRLGRLEEADACQHSAIALAAKLGLEAERGSALSNLGQVLRDRGRQTEALALLEEGLALHRKTGSRRNEAVTLGNLATLHENLGDLAQCRAFNEAALALHRAIGNRLGEGMELSNLASRLAEAGEHAQAAPLFEQALAIQRELGDRENEAITLSNIAEMESAQGQTKAAEQHFARALELTRQTRDAVNEALTLCSLAEHRVHRAHGRQAGELLERALEIARRIQSRRCESRVKLMGARLDLLEGRREAARAAWREGADMMRELDMKQSLARAEAAMREQCARQGVPPLDAV